MTMSGRSYLRWFWIVAGLGFVLDIASKYAITAWLEPSRGLWNDPRGGIWTPYLQFIHKPDVNQGALWGAGGQFGGTANYLFAAFSVLAGAVIIYVVMQPSNRGDLLLNLCLGLILAGATGNMYDRLVFGGVRDWILVYYPSPWNNWQLTDFPVFNIADSCLVCGAILLLIQAFFTKSAPAPQTQEAAAGAAIKC